MKTFVALAAAALLCAATQAQAQAYSEAQTVRVSYADLDLARASGRAVLEQRVKQAIERVCPNRPAPAELGHYKIYRDCKAATWDGVQTQLAQIYDGRHLADSAVRVVASTK